MVAGVLGDRDRQGPARGHARLSRLSEGARRLRVARFAGSTTLFYARNACSRSRVVLIAALMCTVGCPSRRHRRHRLPHNAIDIGASFGRTWDAVIDEFARSNIPIKTIDRSSGLIATDALKVGPSLGDAADCGKDAIVGPVYPTDATYNALVRGDSSRTSLLQITVRWIRVGKSRVLGDRSIVNEECSTRATWEMSLQQKIKQAAEAKGAK